jgi:molybdate transport system substrate-binding protein
MAELKVLSAGAVKTGVAKMIAAFSRERGTPVNVEFTTAPGVRDRVAAGEEADVVVAPPEFLDELSKAGKIVPDTRAFLGRARMGVVVHAQSSIAAVAGVDDLKRMLTGASAVVRNKASSGIYTAKLLENLGLTQLLGSRLVIVESGADIMRYVAEHGPDAIGLGQISEIRVLIEKGFPIRLAGPLPDAVQNVTSYEAVAVAGRAQQAAAAALASFMATPEAKAVFAATGID